MDKEPLFKSVFGPAWEKLPPVFRKRYSNRPYSDDLRSVEGKMEIHFSKVMALFTPFFRLLHVLVPYQGKDIFVHVDFRSRRESPEVCLERKFYFPGKQVYEFNSCMQILADQSVVERMAFGMGWKTHYFFDGEKVVMRHRAYLLKLFGFNIRVPLEIFFGKGHAEEIVIDDNAYSMTMTMTHPLFGILYHYSGNFTFIS